MAPALVSGPEVGVGPASLNLGMSGVDSLLRETGWSIASLREWSFILLFFILDFQFFVSVNVFEFCQASNSNVFFSKTKNKETQWWGGFLRNLSYMKCNTSRNIFCSLIQT